MADKQVKVAKPKTAKPTPTKPDSPKPAPISVPKADADNHGHTCVRCGITLTAATGEVRQKCSSCDKALQEMHWEVERILFRRTVYIPPAPHDEGPTLKWLLDNGYAEHLRRTAPPYMRDFSRTNPAFALAM